MNRRPFYCLQRRKSCPEVGGPTRKSVRQIGIGLTLGQTNYRVLLSFSQHSSVNCIPRFWLCERYKDVTFDHLLNSQRNPSISASRLIPATNITNQKCLVKFIIYLVGFFSDEGVIELFRNDLLSYLLLMRVIPS